MPNIRPLSELRNNTTDVISLAHQEREPIFITKNGYADVVLMSMDTYESSIARLDIYEKLAASQQEVESGKPLKSLDEIFNKYRETYGAKS